MGALMAGPTTYFDPSDASALDALPARTADLVRRRVAALGPAYRLFYREPVEFVRGSGAHLTDRDGNDWLDAYNNVPSVGHAHPRVAAAIAEQAARLTTHTRYLDEATVRYAEDLLGTFPGDDLAHVMFTCTGSEANDLALRIAKTATGGTGVIVTRHAYHGVTSEIAAISPSLGGERSIAPWVRLVDAPEPGVDFAASVRTALDSLAEGGIRPAALVIDTIFASDGVYPDAAGLAEGTALVRAAGGLLIADEVQPGFGRLGHGLWGYTRHRLDPDLVTLGKPMGNGYPVAGVVGRAAPIAAFADRGRYFNTFGGNPVAIAAAQATLDVVRDEGLIERSATQGAELVERIAAIGDPRIADIRGAGLFIGVDLVDAAGAPDEALTLDVVNALRERHVLIATAGAHNATLKIRPPLAFDDDDADRLLEALAEALRRA